jgi:3-mercaptopyruvate sulfurtransferase SseA
MCDEGYQSSLAAATLRDLGVDATDLEGGFQAWQAAGLPVEHQPPPEPVTPVRARSVMNAQLT